MILLALVAAAAQPAQSPKAYMQRLYANYAHSDYSPFTHPERVFAPRLLSAINEDSKLANGEVGYLDGDPVCEPAGELALKGFHRAVPAFRVLVPDAPRGAART